MHSPYRVLFLDIDGPLNPITGDDPQSVLDDHIASDYITKGISYLANSPFLKGLPEGVKTDPFRYCNPLQFSGITNEALRILYEATKRFRLKVVISSTWRIEDDLNAERFTTFFVLRGYWIEVVGATNNFNFHTPDKYAHINKKRAAEIQQWLDKSERPVEDFVILDDSADEIGEKFHGHFYDTFLHEGARRMITQKFLDWLENRYGPGHPL